MVLLKSSTRLASLTVSVFGGGDEWSVPAGEVDLGGGSWVAEAEHGTNNVKLAARTARPIWKQNEKHDMSLDPRIDREMGIRLATSTGAWPTLASCGSMHRSHGKGDDMDRIDAGEFRELIAEFPERLRSIDNFPRLTARTAAKRIDPAAVELPATLSR